MRRPLVLAGIATFAAVDVLLVALAVARVGPTDAAGSPPSPAGQAPAAGEPRADRSWDQTACLPPGGAARGIAVWEREVYVQQGGQIVRGDRDGFGTIG